MKRLFLSTDSQCLSLLTLWKGLKPSVREAFRDGPVGFNPETGCFEAMAPDKNYRIIILNDLSAEPFGAVTVHPDEDYLIYHQNTVKPAILKPFSPARMIAASHSNDTKKSAFARVLSELANGLPSEGVDALIKELMPDAKREIMLFLCGFERMPELPKSLEGLRGEYEEIRKLEGKAKAAAKSSGDHLFEKKKEFIRKCIEIHDSL